MAAAHIVDALATDRIEAARAIVFEYLASTQGEAGLPVPQGIADLPTSLRAVHASLAQRHAEPGALLLAIDGDEVCGCVGLSRSDLTEPNDGLVQRLYVRALHRRRGIARALMAAVHEHARRHGFDRLVLNVMPSRVGAISFYRGLGYRPIPDVAGWPYAAVWLAYDMHSQDS
jgi:ribosomal protein S18 acetylase RimI-like enzyme